MGRKRNRMHNNQTKRNILHIIKRFLMAINFILMAWIFYRNIGGNELSGGFSRLFTLIMVIFFLMGAFYLITGRVRNFSADGMDVLLLCLFTFGASVWTLVRGILFVAREWPLGEVLGNLDFNTLVELYHIPGAVLGMWTAWFILRSTMGNQD